MVRDNVTIGDVFVSYKHLLEIHVQIDYKKFEDGANGCGFDFKFFNCKNKNLIL